MDDLFAAVTLSSPNCQLHGFGDMRGLQVADHRLFVQYVVANMQVIVKRQDRAHGARITGMVRHHAGSEGDVISVACHDAADQTSEGRHLMLTVSGPRGARAVIRAGSGAGLRAGPPVISLARRSAR
jgi:hypothetical protein